MTVWHEIADRVWVRRYRFFDQTIGVVGGDDGLLVIDTRTSHRQGDELRADLRELPGTPHWVVNTHHHHDHCFGNWVFRDAELWGHARCSTRLVEHGEAMRAELIADLPKAAEEWREVIVTPPVQTFDSRATIDLGGRAVELRYLGRGHTDDDIVVTVPAVGVVFAGDLLENGAPPYFGDGFPLDWPATVEAVLGLGMAGPVAAGHGEVADRAFVGRSLEELHAVADLGRRVAADELSVDGAVARGPYGPKASREPIERAAAQARGELD
ncbi:MAG TPA: MBL fold metallo-hydrolase [Candidatus Limnocylindrales bacterium]